MTYRNKKLREFARHEPCVACGADNGTTVWAHSNQQIFGKGMGIKASDAAAMCLCFRCHANHDQGDRGEDWRQREFEWIAKSLVRAIEKGVLK